MEVYVIVEIISIERNHKAKDTNQRTIKTPTISVKRSIKQK